MADTTKGSPVISGIASMMRVGVQLQFSKLQDAIVIDVLYVQQVAVYSVPGADPVAGRQTVCRQGGSLLRI